MRTILLEDDNGEESVTHTQRNPQDPDEVGSAEIHCYQSQG